MGFKLFFFCWVWYWIACHVLLFLFVFPVGFLPPSVPQNSDGVSHHTFSLWRTALGGFVFGVVADTLLCCWRWCRSCSIGFHCSIFCSRPLNVNHFYPSLWFVFLTKAASQSALAPHSTHRTNGLKVCENHFVVVLEAVAGKDSSSPTGCSGAWMYQAVGSYV